MLRLRKYLNVKGIPMKACAGYLGITEKTLYNKVSGDSDFNYKEICELRKLLPEYNIDYLLSEDEDIA